MFTLFIILNCFYVTTLHVVNFNTHVYRCSIYHLCGIETNNIFETSAERDSDFKTRVHFTLDSPWEIRTAPINDDGAQTGAQTGAGVRVSKRPLITGKQCIVL